jgi:hypothetical protein
VKADPNQAPSKTNAPALLTVALCKNLVIPAKGVYWSDGRYARETMRAIIDVAVAAGMQSCDPLKQEPTSDVFARGIAQGRDKAVAVGTVKSPRHLFLSVRASDAYRVYVGWTLTSTNGTRTETTHDDGQASSPLKIELPIGMVGAKSCSATASAAYVVPAGYATPTGTISVELLNKP